MFIQLKIVKTILRIQMPQEYLNTLIKIRHDSDSFYEIKGTAVYP